MRLIADLKAERARIIEDLRRQHRPMSWREQGRLFEWYSRQVDGLLDSGLGHCWLAKREIAQLVADSIRHFEGPVRLIQLGCDAKSRPRRGASSGRIQPFSDPPQLEGLLCDPGEPFAPKAGESFWQRESYDHVIRDGEEMVRLNAYVEWNPVKAGLCETPEEWKWSSAFGRSSEAVEGTGCLPEGG